jgi:hypothetical protein
LSAAATARCGDHPPGWPSGPPRQSAARHVYTA